MFERFSDRARRVVVLAQEEARLLSHDHIGTEHLLLGLIHEGEGVAARALVNLSVSLEAVRTQVEEMIGHGRSAPSGQIPFTPRAKTVLELSLREALQLGHDYIGTEHILLGLIREGEGVASKVLVSLGADLSRVRTEVISLLGKPAEERPSETLGQETGAATSVTEVSVPPDQWPACPHCRAPLAGSATAKVLEVPVPEGKEHVALAFVYCGRCGMTLGVLRP